MPEFYNAEKVETNDLKLLADHKLVIYQLLVRLFGNINQTNKHYGSIEETVVESLMMLPQRLWKN